MLVIISIASIDGDCRGSGSNGCCDLDRLDLVGYCVNRIQGKSVHARAFARERLQHHVSYVGIDMSSRKILKTMYRTISK